MTAPRSTDAEEQSPEDSSPGANSTVPQPSSFPWKSEIDFMNDDTHSTPIQATLAINETGVYIMMFVVCDPALAEVCPTQISMLIPFNYTSLTCATASSQAYVWRATFSSLGRMWHEQPITACQLSLALTAPQLLGQPRPQKMKY